MTEETKAAETEVVEAEEAVGPECHADMIAAQAKARAAAMRKGRAGAVVAGLEPAAEQPPEEETAP